MRFFNYFWLNLLLDSAKNTRKMFKKLWYTTQTLVSIQLFWKQGLYSIKTSQKFTVPAAPNRVSLDYNWVNPWNIFADISSSKMKMKGECHCIEALVRFTTNGQMTWNLVNQTYRIWWMCKYISNNNWFHFLLMST